MIKSNFIKLPSGVIINLERVVFVGRINAIKESERARKASEWSLSIQFIGDDRPYEFYYTVESEARNDYDAILNACENYNK